MNEITDSTKIFNLLLELTEEELKAVDLRGRHIVKIDDMFPRLFEYLTLDNEAVVCVNKDSTIGDLKKIIQEEIEPLEKAGKSVKRSPLKPREKTIQYTDEPMELGEIIDNLLPSPSELQNASTIIYKDSKESPIHGIWVLEEFNKWVRIEKSAYLYPTLECLLENHPSLKELSDLQYADIDAKGSGIVASWTKWIGASNKSIIDTETLENKEIRDLTDKQWLYELVDSTDESYYSCGYYLNIQEAIADVEKVKDKSEFDYPEAKIFKRRIGKFNWAEEGELVYHLKYDYRLGEYTTITNFES